MVLGFSFSFSIYVKVDTIVRRVRERKQQGMDQAHLDDFLESLNEISFEVF